MQRWNHERMLSLAQQLFATLHKRKYSCNPNHDIHLLARDLGNWLPKIVQSLINGDYVSQPIRRYYFDDEVVDQLEIKDRIAQHVLLKELKPTFKHIVHPHCYHMLGPTGVKRATKHIEQALKTNEFHYVLRADIKSFYRSISHDKLINDIKTYFNDPHVIHMLEDIIRNPIDTPRGYKNPHTGIALRGPLSQLFSAIFLKPLDEAFDAMDVVYARYQDDLLVLCKTKSQLNRCRRKLMNILHERGLSLSRKKSMYGLIENEFHFLGVHYSGTQTSSHTTSVCVNDSQMNDTDRIDHLLDIRGGVERFPTLKIIGTNHYA